RGGVKFDQRAIIILVDPVHALTESEMRLGQILLQLKGNIGFDAGFRFPSIQRFVIMKNRRARGSESRMGQSELWIEPDSGHVKLLRLFVVPEQCVRIALNLVSLQINQVSIG